MTPACFTVQQLAARWGCHRSHVYRMIERGELAVFRIGNLARIPAAEVERIECPAPVSRQNSLSPSSDSERDGPLSGMMGRESAGVSVSTRPIGSGRRPRPGADGRPGTVLPGRWAGQ
jgi:excisionase family DNA binding protein